MASLFQKSSRSTSFMWALFVFSLNLFSLVSAMSGSASYFEPPYEFEGCPDVDVQGIMYMKVDDELWRQGEACGEKYNVTCIAMVDKGKSPCVHGGPSIEAEVAGRCRNCETKIVLTKEAYAKLATTKAHVLNFNFVK